MSIFHQWLSMTRVLTRTQLMEKSVYGGVIFMAGGPVWWISKMLPHIALSAHHAEYMGAGFVTRTVIWMRQLLNEMKLSELVREPTPMLGDNDATTNLAYENLVTTGNKYFFLPYHFFKQCTELRCIRPLRVDTKWNLSDPLSKAITKGVHEILNPILIGGDTNKLQEIIHEHMLMNSRQIIPAHALKAFQTNLINYNQSKDTFSFCF